VSRVADAMGVSRPHLSKTSREAPRDRGPYRKAGDAELLERIRAIVDARPTYGYRRVTAALNREPGAARVNHKRVYRVMEQAELLLPIHTGNPQRPHQGKVVTLKSDLRWCSDAFEIRCWNGDRVHVAFALDCCDREAIAWVARAQHVDSQVIRDLMAMSVEARFGGTRTSHPVQWLSDNGPPYTANETRAFGRVCGLQVCRSATRRRTRPSPTGWLRPS
jgi:putative transposase